MIPAAARAGGILRIPSTMMRSMTSLRAWRVPGWMLGLLAAAALTSGCTALQPPRVESLNLHVLGAMPAARPARARQDVVVEVALPRAWPGFDTPQMAYVRQPYELDYFASSRWADTPARMLGPLLASALEQAGSFRAVVQMPTAVLADLRIETELIRLQQDFATQPSRVELAVRVQLIDVRGRRILASRLFEETEPARSDDAAGGVMAANVALARLLERVVDYCIEQAGAR
jgi:cholesterol transport system auxiliary component